MSALDNNYTLLQFRNRVYTINGSEYQRFFESVLEVVYSDFQKIRPYGNEGDGGNDGYRKKSGVYYQVYAPEVPDIKEAVAARKLVEDFEKLKINWSEISNINEYNFVFNDKYSGSIQRLEEAVTKLEKENPSVDFKLFLAKDLEKEFLKLRESDLLSLNFNVDKRQSVSNAHEYLNIVRLELDRENTYLAMKILENTGPIISNISDEGLSLEFELLESSGLNKAEKIDEAKVKYKSLVERFNNDSRALLYLSEIYMSDNNFDKSKACLDEAEKIDGDFWLLELERLVCKLRLNEVVNIESIDESNFPSDSRIKANFYRLYSLVYEINNDHAKADSFIEKSLHLSPYRFSSYVTKLTINEMRLGLIKGGKDKKNVTTQRI